MRIDDLLTEGDGLLRLADHPRSARTIHRAAASGRVVAILPGVFVAPERQASPSVRIRAACAWSAKGTIHGLTAVQLHLRLPVTLPIRLRAPYRGDPPDWLRVSLGTVNRPIDQQGIRVATAAHAVVEVAAIDNGEAAFRALRRRLVRPEHLLAVLSEFRGSPGNLERARVIGLASHNPWSYGEALLHELLRAAHLDGWVANRPLRIQGQLVFPDILIAAHRLAIEFDGEAVHSGHDQFEDDRRRQNLLVLGGLRVLRFTWEAVTKHPDEVVATIRAAVAAVS